jgi:hypothetical protein
MAETRLALRSMAKNLEFAELEKVTSGSWVLDRRVLCPTRRQARRIDRNGRDPRAAFPGYTPVLSPFQTGSGAARSGGAPENQTFGLPFPQLGAVLTGPRNNPTRRSVDTFRYWENRAIMFSEVPDHLATKRLIRDYLLASAGVESKQEYVDRMKRDNNIPPASPCTRVVRGRACFGDCLMYPEGTTMVQYMATNHVGLKNLGDFAVCGDNLAEFFATQTMSDRSKQTYCEKYVTDSLVTGRSTAITCSSYRLRVDCSSLF